MECRCLRCFWALSACPSAILPGCYGLLARSDVPAGFVTRQTLLHLCPMKRLVHRVGDQDCGWLMPGSHEAEHLVCYDRALASPAISADVGRPAVKDLARALSIQRCTVHLRTGSCLLFGAVIIPLMSPNFGAPGAQE